MKYFLIGIKGSGMTALGCILKDMGNEVVGSDVLDVYFTDQKLVTKNIDFFGFDANNIDPTIDYVIVGNAFSFEHEEVKQALALNIKVMRYFEFVAKLARQYNSIAIAGTNGKTTTTGLVTTMLKDHNLLYLIGDGTGIGTTNPDYFVYEACEYKNTFHNYYSKIGLINNIEFDHPDFFKDIEHVLATYQQFATQCEKLVINVDDENCQKIMHDNKITYGIDNEDADINIKKVKNSANGFSFSLYVNKLHVSEYFLPLFGKHMIYNVLAAIAINYALGLEIDDCIKNLATFKGTSRRFEINVLDEKRQIILIDDYAHHPTAIKYTIEAVKQKYPDYVVSVLFQPHTYSRTKSFLTEFAQSLLDADNIYLTEIFGSVREQEADINIEVLIKAVEELGTAVERNLDFIKHIKTNHVITILGAGNIDKTYIPKIKKLIKE